MRKIIFALTLLISCSALRAQEPAKTPDQSATSSAGQTTTPAERPNNPKDLFALAAPYYDYSAGAMKPWHMSVKYQMLDEDGKVTAEGTFEHWWASPKESRTTWMENGKEKSEWRTNEGRHFTAGNIDQMHFNIENRLDEALINPMPGQLLLNSKDITPHYVGGQAGGADLSCVQFARESGTTNSPSVPVYGYSNYPTYCFDVKLPSVITGYVKESQSVLYHSITKFQGHNFPKALEIRMNGKTRLKATVDDVSEIDADNPALNPSPEAREIPKRISISGGVMAGMIEHKEAPYYPLDAKAAGIQGTVVLHVLISKDGTIQNPEVVQSPNESLTKSAIEAVSKWKYRPYLLNGEPVTVDTQINVVFSLSK